MLNIFINTWGNYNERGADRGEWVTLPMDPDDLKEKLEAIAARMGDNAPEFCIHDYEWTTEVDLKNIDENENILKLNDLVTELDDLNEYEQKEVAAAVEAFGYTVEEALSKQQRGYFTFYADMDLEEVAEEIVNDCYITRDTPDIFTRYFDYEAFARDLGYDGYCETEYGVIVE